MECSVKMKEYCDCSVSVIFIHAFAFVNIVMIQKLYCLCSSLFCQNYPFGAIDRLLSKTLD